MFSLLKIKKGNISIIFLLVFNQLFLNGYAFSQRKILGEESPENIQYKSDDEVFGLFQIKKYKNQNKDVFHKSIIDQKIAEELLIKNNLSELDLEGFQETVNNQKLENESIYKELKNKYILTETNYSGKSEGSEGKSDLEEIDNKTNYKELKEKYILNEEKDSSKFENSEGKSDLEEIDNKTNYVELKNEYLITIEEKEIDKSQLNKLTNKKNNQDQKVQINLPLPSQSKISASEFQVPSRGYVNLKGPKITLDLKEADSLETLKLISKLANYGIVVMKDNADEKDKALDNPKITAYFEETDISNVFNSILLSSNLQAVVENNIIFVGKNILTKSLKPKVSKTYRLNQVNAASVADYLSTIGAQISKVMVVSGSIDGEEIGEGLVNKKEFNDKLVNPYGIEGGPLYGLIGTADLRLQTITLIGSREQISTAEKYIKALDTRHRQVALTIQILDVSLTKNDIKNNVFELTKGSTTFISNSGLSLITGNMNSRFLPEVGATVESAINDDALRNNEFVKWITAKITNEDAKVLASPTLILGENPNVLTSGAAKIDDELKEATIGRPFKNEGFIKVGETVIIGFTKTTNEGVVTCTGKLGTAGITFGAKVEKIDDNGFVTFALSPAISAVTKSVEISGCGIQNTLSVRKLDTGSIRVKNGDTLILTGVLQDADNAKSSKVPILGDIPILGSLFRSNTTVKRKSELIILVTPRILKDE